MDNKHYIALRYVGASGMVVADALRDNGLRDVSSTLTAFCIKAAELSQTSNDDEEEEEAGLPTLTYDEMKSLMAKLGTSGEEMHKLRRSILSHLDQLFEDGLIDLKLVNYILQYSFSQFAYHDSVTTELVTRIIVKFHMKLDALN